MKYFEEGMVVYNLTFGKGMVVNIETKGDFPVVVKYEKYEGEYTYTYDGRYLNNSGIELFQEPIIIPENKPLEEFKKGEVVLVSDDEENWFIKYYIEKKTCNTYPYRTTSCLNLERKELYTVNKYCKPYKP